MLTIEKLQDRYIIRCTCGKIDLIVFDEEEAGLIAWKVQQGKASDAELLPLIGWEGHTCS